ncbi:unnamed protein product [Cylindrotheca closterium]|uniref:Methyltransferase type 11 domain-containing protein n=1 Tax=Cylindrotheca closterium TaxID=2856 RepID=A0AAD2G1Q4_9STRA|nr:unnamed protein product [Cylindrotheca closterium]
MIIDSALQGHNDVVYDAIQAEYKDMANWYDTFWHSYTSQTLIEPIHQVMELGVGKNSNVVVDIACGTGEFFRRLRNLDDTNGSISEKPFNRKKKAPWIGIEPCPEMLKRAKEKFPKNDHAIAIVLHQAPAEYLPIKDHSADIVVTTNAFHFFRDKQRALHEMRRILKGGGTLIITDWCNDFWIVKLYHWLERLRWNWRFEQKYPGPLKKSELSELVNSEGFQDVEVSSYRVRVFGIFFWGMQTLKAHPISGSI